MKKLERSIMIWRLILGLSLCVLLVVLGLMVFGVASHNTVTELDGDWTLPQSKHAQSRVWYCGWFLPQTNYRNIDSIYTSLSLVVYTQSKLIRVWKWLRWCLSSLQAYPSLKGYVDYPKPELMKWSTVPKFCCLKTIHSLVFRASSKTYTDQVWWSPQCNAQWSWQCLSSFSSCLELDTLLSIYTVLVRTVFGGSS